MKKIMKLFIFLVLLIIVPSNVLAANSPNTNKSYTYKNISINLNDIGIQSNDSFPLYEAYDSDDDLHFHIYSLDSENSTSTINTLNVKTKDLIDSEKQKLLNQLLTNVNQINKTNSEDISNITNTTELLSTVSTQILVWEITSGKRISFDTIPTSSDYYKNLISINRNNTLSSGLPSLYDVYSNIVTNIKEKNSKSTNNSESNPYKLYYNVTNDRYQNIISSLDYTKLNNTYEIKNDTNIKLGKNSGGLLAYVSNKNFFNDVKSISLNQKSGSTNSDLQNFYYFTGKNDSEAFVLASKADIVPTKLYFTCAQGNFKITNLEGSGGLILGSTYNIKDSNGKLLKFVNEEKNIFTYDSDGNTGVTDITYSTTNSYTINALPDGEYTIIQTKVPAGNSFSEKEEDRTIKIKIDNGNFYSYNKILKKYEINVMRIVKFTNYTSRLYIIDNGSTDNAIYKITNNNGENIGLYRDSNKKIWQAYTNDSSSKSFNEFALETTKRSTILGLPAGTFTITKIDNNVTETRKVTIYNNKNIGDSILISFDNKKGEINFYKLDQNGNYLEGGLFSLKTINNTTSEEIDVALTKSSSDNSYTISDTGEEYTFPVTSGSVNIKGAKENITYRITELSPPEGYEIYDTNISYVDVVFDENGYAMSTPYIINKEIMVKEDASSSAELIIALRTGKEIIKYGSIVLGVALIVFILFIVKKNSNK